MDGILPAAGQSSRMRGLPKFLLPCDDNYVTLLEYHIGMMYESCDVIWIPTRSEFVQLIESLNFPRDKVVILPLTTRSMTETVMNVLNISGSMSFLLEMPDTFYQGVKPVDILNHSPVIADL
jgi:CTP:molybdopterin cytidylyltransferase MocA